MTVPARLSLVTLGVTDLTRSTAFYEALGWRRSSSSAEGVSFFRTAGSVLALWGRDELAADAGLPDPGELPAYRGVALAMNLDSEQDVDRVYAEALAAGATELKRPEKAFWGGYTSYLADPEGHVWEIAYNPFWPITAEGTVDLPE